MTSRDKPLCVRTSAGERPERPLALAGQTRHQLGALDLGQDIACEIETTRREATVVAADNFKKGRSCMVRPPLAWLRP